MVWILCHEVTVPKQLLEQAVVQGWQAALSLQQSETQFRRLLEKLPAGAYTCDPEGLITYYNQHAVQLWGREPKLNDVADRFCGSFKLFSADALPIDHAQCWMALALQHVQEYNGHEIIIERPDGERLTALAHANPIYDEDGKLVGAVNVLVDITERKRAEVELRRRQDEIEELNRRLKRAMTETHHRVKNNLQIIAAMVDMRLMDNPETLQPEDLRRIGDHTRTLAAMHDLLTQESKEEGDAHFLSAREVLQKLVYLLQQGAGDRTFTTRFDDARLTARQSTSLALLVSELVSNAIKHGSGEVEVSFRTAGNTGVLEVRDDGPGFPSDFDVQSRANTGLELVENLSRWDLDSEVFYENREEGGARVIVKIPLKA
jgi:PAS domain S-box-containing protein